MRSAKAVVSENFARYGRGGASMPYTTATAPSQSRQHTLTSLKRWSVANKELPAVSQIRAVHVYDFDNTLFLSPLPNPQLWHGSTIGHIQSESHFANGGWWHDPNILSATGKGLEAEELRAWEGWWNENILRLVRYSMEQKDALTVLLTGRSEAGFAELIKRMVASQKLDFDMVSLKPEVGPDGRRFPSTGAFKHAFLGDLVHTYDQAEEIRIYEDRPKHVKGFRDHFEEMNRKLQSGHGHASRKPITAEVIQVSEGSTYLDPVNEAAEVQRMINSHNLALRSPSLAKFKGYQRYMRIKRTIIYTGYLISQNDSNRMIEQVLSPLVPNGLAESNDLKYMANNILITPRPAAHSVLDKVGGIGKKINWQVTGTAVYENRVFAARVSPIPATEQVYTENPVPLIVLAVRKGARPVEASKITNWQPVSPNHALVFETEVGEKVILRVDDDDKAGPPRGPKNPRKRYLQDREEQHAHPSTAYSASHETQSHGFHPYQRPGGDNRSYNDDSSPKRGAYRGRGRGSGRGRGQAARGGRGRGRGAREGGANPFYKSLDDYSNAYEGSYENKGGNNGGYPMDY
ncbi:hypothetical protein N7456_000216 [Penicillium angulare]|uniref:Swiss Army Knife RNA repair protein HAD domain-containing protein n=1 Tax=Penicillium angulare TaxID=116970 RepID=A0A9W9GD39_9EURO|nr:hypothetical protein N7456_000216 [Penicillium angulare]